jgi:transcriptional regulator with XRE-family HTH domain
MKIGHYTIVKTPLELGKLARIARSSFGTSLRDTSAKSKLGVRFLSEFERGKATAEIGKVIQALQAAELDLAVVPRQNNIMDSERLSQQLELEFPYDWSNTDIDESVFIRLVLEKTRFNDILRIAHYFGLERIDKEAKFYANSSQKDILTKYLSRIRAGFEIAKT